MRALSTVSPVTVTGSNLTLVYVVLGISLAALAIAYGLRAQVLAASDGTPKMREIAEAIQEGAAAFLARQFRTLSFFVVIVFLVMLKFASAAQSSSYSVQHFLHWLVTTACGLQCAQMFALQMLPVTRMAKRQYRSHFVQVASLV
jgi:K(+)-stimulated pyrophosphate-energized sodium pump